jgi:EmrB/QacA subfamily drug resistance transporter
MLLVVCLAQFMVILDVAVVNVALPSIRGGLHFSATALPWVVNAYTLSFAGFLMLGGRAADLLGRRRVLFIATAAFALTSLACAFASSRGMLLGARAVQGLAGAFVSPATLSIISTSVPEGPSRNRALGLWAAMGGLGASSGALLGGLLTQTLGWPAIFAVNAPVGALVILLGLRVIPAGAPAGRTATRHFDLSGALLVTAGLVALTFGIVRTATLGWTAPGVLLPLLASVVLLGSFFYVEGRVAAVPLVPMAIFKIRALRAANLVIVLLYMAMFSFWYFLTLYLQLVKRYDALGTGISFVPMALMVFSGSTLAPRLVRRFGVRRVLAGGMLTSAVGLTLLTQLTPSSSVFALVLPAGMLASLGMGLSLVPGTITATQGVERARAGAASGLLNTSRLVGGALGLAILGTLAQDHSRSIAGAHPTAAALTDGFTLAYSIGSVLCVVGAVAAVVLLRPRRTEVEVPALRPIAACASDVTDVSEWA